MPECIKAIIDFYEESGADENSKAARAEIAELEQKNARLRAALNQYILRYGYLEFSNREELHKLFTTM